MFSLIPHPANGTLHADTTLHVTLTRQADGGLRLVYLLHGNTDQCLLPAPQPPAFTDNLWQHTCLEAFIRPATNGDGNKDHAYREFNFSPSGQWAVYDFSAYRERRETPLPDAAPLIRLDNTTATNTLRLDVLIPAALLPVTGEDSTMSLTAVLEAPDGQCSYWATRHATARPDFHHPDTFTVVFPR